MSATRIIRPVMLVNPQCSIESNAVQPSSSMGNPAGVPLLRYQRAFQRNARHPEAHSWAEGSLFAFHNSHHEPKPRSSRSRSALTPRAGTNYHSATDMNRALRLRSPRAPRTLHIAARFLALIALLATVAGASFAQQIPAKPAGYVNDYAGVLSQSTKDQLTSICTQINDKAKAQIFVVTVKSIGDADVQEFSLNLATKWGVGPKASDSGVLIFYAINDRKYFTQVGYGLEGILNDGKVGSFGREAIPYLRSGDYNSAILLVTRRVADVIAQDRGITLTGGTLPPPQRQPVAQESSGWGALIILLIIIVFLFIAMKNSGGGRPGPRGGSGWWVGPMIGGMMGGGGGGGWGGGGGGWSGGGGGGFGGGFGGGGGGSFGGGGAGGSW
jgi:uncharacterized protein